MKRLAMVLAVFMAFTFSMAPTDVYAKKFGGSKSFGKSFKTAPSQQTLKAQPSNNQSATRNQNQTNNQATNTAQKKKGLFGGMAGGLLGGLLAGTLIGSLLSGGGFGGMGFMDLLIFAGLAFLAFKLFKAMRGRSQAPASSQWQSQPGGFRQSDFEQPAQNTSNDFRSQPEQKPDAQFGDGFRSNGFEQPAAQPAAQGFGSEANNNDVPYNLPPDFDMNGFLRRARDHYRSIQEAWNSGDMSTIQEYVSPDLYEHLAKERAAMTGDQHTEVMYVDAEIVRADYIMGKAEVSLRFSGRYRDNVERVEEEITDIWHLEQSRSGAPWLIVGIEYANS
ncbi:Tim44-like domain-containing protein [Parendozoicomonas haliclonae]|uniref:Tim44-like domain protein n=2 Tax=Parendozoicomonas haliclonae TaxID=1960125 RepID=A0A1X7APN8_9GAMM|nr:Tim44-like domain protein [Parendozoicomonas haliclonae]